MAPLSPDIDGQQDPAAELDDLILRLSADPEKDQVVAEIGVLQSIYGDASICVWHRPESSAESRSVTTDSGMIRYVVHVDLPPPHESTDTQLRVLVSLPPAYPTTSPPQLQLLSRYIGAFSVDAAVFGAVLRTYISLDGVEFQPETVCVFDGIENVRERCAVWFSHHLSEERAQEMRREDEREKQLTGGAIERESDASSRHDTPIAASGGAQVLLPADINFFIAEPIVERKSVFIGRACKINEPSQVPVILAHLMSDRRLARAAHPIINAWRCTVNGVVHQDNDDDGETAAGGRLAHLLQILDVSNILVVVTRYFGGVLLGPDRFKHINQAARNALELGGFLDSADDKKNHSNRSRLKKRS